VRSYKKRFARFIVSIQYIWDSISMSVDHFPCCCQQSFPWLRVAIVWMFRSLSSLKHARNDITLVYYDNNRHQHIITIQLLSQQNNFKNGVYPSSLEFLACILVIVISIKFGFSVDPSFGLIDWLDTRILLPWVLNCLSVVWSTLSFKVQCSSRKVDEAWHFSS
jgi:hypothetical protein